MLLPSLFCRDCARQLGHSSTLESIEQGGLAQINDPYQVGKLQKHTILRGIAGINSLFLSSTSTNYLNYMISTMLLGCVEFDYDQRKNFIFIPGVITGLQFNNGAPISDCNAVKAVCTEHSTRAHAYPIPLTPGTRRCGNCGRPITF
jgi:hypothetical protein